MPPAQSAEGETKGETSLGRLGRRMLTALFGAAPFLATVFPRGTPFCLLLFALKGAPLAWRNPSALKADLFAPVTLSLAAFAGLALLSAGWSPTPERALLKGALLLLLCGVSLLAAQLRTGVAADRVDELAAAIGAGIGVGLAFIAFETLTGRYLTRLVFTHMPAVQAIYAGKHLGIGHGGVFLGDTLVNRATCVATVLLIPGLLLAKRYYTERGFRLFAATAAVFTLCVLLFSRHQSSQIALLVAIVVGLLAWRYLGATKKTLIVLWSAAVLLAPFGAYVMGKTGLEDAPWLFNTAKQRVAIWQSVAERIEQHPLLGAGATAGELPMRVDLTPIEAGPSKQPSAMSARHPHDIYLQVWYELGLAGVLLLLLFGWSVFRCIESLARDAQPYALALFGLTAIMAATSYGLWQFWFQCLLALGFVTASLARARSAAARVGAGAAGARRSF